MNIEIHQLELENLIQARLKSSGFRNIEDVLMHDLTIASAMESGEGPTGAGLVAAMQACPIKDIDIEPDRYPMPVRDVVF